MCYQKHTFNWGSCIFICQNLATGLSQDPTRSRSPVPTAGGRARAGQSRRAQPGNAATKGAREAESFHMPDQWGRGDGGANRPETAAQRGGPSAAPAFHWSWPFVARTTRARGGASRGLSPFSLGGDGPGGPPPCQPAPRFPLPWASGFKSGGVQFPSGAQGGARPGQGRPCSPERSRACQWSLPPRSGLPRTPQSALEGFLCPPGYRQALRSFFFFF